MFRKQLESDLKEVFGFSVVRLNGIDDETEVLYCEIKEIVSTPIVGSGKTHFRVYCNLGLNQDEANGHYGYIHHKLLTSNSSRRETFQLQGDEIAQTQTLYEQHRILSHVECVWESDISWNDAPEIESGNIEVEFKN